MKLLAVLGIIALLLFAGCCGSTGGVQKTGQNAANSTASNINTGAVSSNSTTTSTPAISPKNIENGQIGTVYEINYLSSNYQVTLLKTAFDTSTYGGQRYLLANFEIKNIGDGSEYFAPDVYAVDATSEKYDKTIPFMISPDYDKTLDFFKKLTPGTKMSGWVAMEVPANVTEFDLYFEYTNSFLSKTPQYIKYKVA